MKREQAENIDEKIHFSQIKKKNNYESKTVPVPSASNCSIWKRTETVAQKQIYLNWAHFHPPATVSF